MSVFGWFWSPEKAWCMGQALYIYQYKTWYFNSALALLEAQCAQLPRRPRIGVGHEPWPHGSWRPNVSACYHAAMTARLLLALALIVTAAACTAPKPQTVLDRACDVCRKLEPWCSTPSAAPSTLTAPSSSASATTP
jgi:hypothetical protein